MVSDRIDQCEIGQASTVFGLVGPWGSGKTTLLREIAHQVPSWTIVRFSPWSSGDVASLTREFVSALSEAFPSTQLKRNLARYARFGSPFIRLIPFAGNAIASVADVAIGDWSKRPAWHTEFDSLTQAIEAQRQRVLVVVDDVDRLDEAELRSLLRVVRLLGRFTNVHYLLAYDQETLDGILSSPASSGRSSAFMEKIVQFPFEVPPTAMAVRRRWAREILDQVDPAKSVTDSSYLDQREEFINVLALALHTPRAFERLREQLKSHNSLIAAAELDAMDITAVTWLRITHHAVWDQIRLNSEQYTSWRESDTEEIRAAQMAVVEPLIVAGDPRPVREMLGLLFVIDGMMSVNTSRSWRIADAGYFSRYFEIGLSEDDISEQFVERAVEHISEAERNEEEVDRLLKMFLRAEGEQSAIALNFSRTLRRDKRDASLSMLDFVEDIHTRITNSSAPSQARLSAVDQWLAREVFMVFKAGLLAPRELADRFGFLDLARGAYAMNRMKAYEDGDVKALYGSIAHEWIDHLSGQPLAEVLKTTDLPTMTRFCIWTGQVGNRRGFLSHSAPEGENLLAVAIKFVIYEEWHGSAIHFEVSFRSEEFGFAMGDYLTAEALATIPPATPVPPYEVNDLPERNLSDVQIRDFAIRSLKRLDL